MLLTGKLIYNSFLEGANKVIENAAVLNKINVFPVVDGDTGSNLASTMRSIIVNSKEGSTVKDTLESVANAAIKGARGNSGIIFAQYLSGLSESIGNGTELSFADYARASEQAANYALEALENPVEGTIITMMNEWGKALQRASAKSNTLAGFFEIAYRQMDKVLEKTKEQLSVLKKFNVVDSGAKGFLYFVEGALQYIRGGAKLTEHKILDLDSLIGETEIYEEYDGNRYCTECLLNGKNIDKAGIKEKISVMGSSVVVAGNDNFVRVHIHTNEPAGVFKLLQSFGEIAFTKADDMYMQDEIKRNRLSKVAIVTDSIADLPQKDIDASQIHVLHLGILLEQMVYLDKLTIDSASLIELEHKTNSRASSSQPNEQQIENLFSYLSTYYDSAIVLSVSSKLSGTYGIFCRLAKNFEKEDFKISVLDSRQNSSAQGLLVKRLAGYVNSGLSHELALDKINTDIENSKILVQVKQLDNMIRSGRLSVRAAKLAKMIGLKPIVSLDKAGSGKLEGISFSDKCSRGLLLTYIRMAKLRYKILEYSLSYVGDKNAALSLSKELEHILGFPPAYIAEASSIIAIGAGSGALAVSYIKES